MWSISSHERGFQLERAGVTLTIPATLAGIKVLQSLLLGWGENDRIGTPAFPFQDQLDLMVKRWRDQHPALISLEELGL